MGTTLSTFLLLVGSLVVGVMSSVAANYARQDNWDKTKLYSGLSMGIAIALILLTLFIVVRGHTGASEITGVIEEMAFGVMISYIVMVLVMVGVAVLDILTLIDASKSSSTAFGKAVGAAAVAFGGFVLSLFIIIFLL
jgi:hypothetical protein